MEKEKITIILLGILILVSTLTTAQTIIGVSPSKIGFENVLRGGYSEKIITITSSSEDDVIVEIEPRGEIVNWLNFSETKFTVSRNEPYRLKISTNPPADLPNNNYSGFLRVEVTNQNSNIRNNGATGKIIPVLDLFMDIQITDTEYFSCIARKYNVNSVEEGEELAFRANILNNGNVRLKPKFKIDIWDQEQIDIVKSYDFTEDIIFPTTEQDIEILVPTSGLELGQYWAEIYSLDCFSTALLTFDVLEEGSLTANGVLKEIKTKTWIDSKDTTLIEALFSNTGEKDVTAYFKGRVTLGDKTIQLIETEEARISIGESEIFPFYFTPTKAGKYLVSGRVFYDNKRTFEKSAVINVRQTGIRFSELIKYIIYISLISGIIYFTYKIRKEKKKINKELRMIKR